MADAEQPMVRSGTVTLLGAGASADAGYQTAGGLLEIFRRTLDDAGRQERENLERMNQQLIEQGLPLGTVGQNEPTTAEWFKTMWERFERITERLRPLAMPKLESDGKAHLPSLVVPSPEGGLAFTPYAAPVEGEPPYPAPIPYLETFFAFYDDYMRPMMAAREGDPGALRASQYRFRRLRDLAVETVYRAFSAHGREPARYLTRLFELRGPGSHRSAISTLNFDVTVEQAASMAGLDLWDGFAQSRLSAESGPPGWGEPGIENLSALWEATEENGHEFVGFQKVPAQGNLLLKLHGSLGWYVLEEGSGDIGSRDELRHNTAYKHFRVPYGLLWSPESSGLADQMASGGPADPVTRTAKGSLSRKAGAVWVRPYLVFARALKSHPDRVSVELMATFYQLLEASAAILVIGYSWGDPHVNDVIFDAVARGALLVYVSQQARPENVLALWIQRFPTTFHVLRRRLFIFGGGAKAVLEERTIDLPSGDSREFDLVGSLPHSLPAELSLEATLSW